MNFWKKRKNESCGMLAGVFSRLFRKKDERIQEADQSATPANEKPDSEISIVASHVGMESVVVEEVKEVLEPDKTEENEDDVGEPFQVDSRYDENGFDCAGFSQQYYRTAVDSLLNRVCKAGKQMQDGNYEYAIFGAKTAAELAAIGTSSDDL